MANIMVGGPLPLPIHDRQPKVLTGVGGGGGGTPPPTTGQIWPRGNS